MKKSEFLAMIGKSGPLGQCYVDLSNKYHTSFENMLAFLGDSDPDIKLEVLERIEKEKTFEAFVKDNQRENDKKAVKNCLAEIEAQLKQWIKDIKWVKSNKDEPIIRFSEEYSKTSQQYKKRQKVGKVYRIFAYVLFGALFVLVAIFGMLDNFSVLDFGGQIAGACGILDFIVGVSFFVYEKIDDSKTKYETVNIEKAYETLKNDAKVCVNKDDKPPVNVVVIDNVTGTEGGTAIGIVEGNFIKK